MKITRLGLLLLVVGLLAGCNAQQVQAYKDAIATGEARYAELLEVKDEAVERLAIEEAKVGAALTAIDDNIETARASVAVMPAGADRDEANALLDKLQAEREGVSQALAAFQTDMRDVIDEASQVADEVGQGVAAYRERLADTDTGLGVAAATGETVGPMLPPPWSYIVGAVIPGFLYGMENRRRRKRDGELRTAKGMSKHHADTSDYNLKAMQEMEEVARQVIEATETAKRSGGGTIDFKDAATRDRLRSAMDVKARRYVDGVRKGMMNDDPYGDGDITPRSV